jgi:hypothetical protein
MGTEKKRLSKKALHAVAWGSSAFAFALPWAAFRLAPVAFSGAQGAPAQQVVVVPAGSKVVVTKSPSGTTGVQVIRAKGTAPGSVSAPVATTGASAPPVR